MSAAEARALVKAARTATLATAGAEGAPLATLVAVTDDGGGRPLLLLSGLAEHTKNLRARADASVLIAGADGPTMNRPRVTLSGRIVWLAGDEAAAAKARFTQTHDEAKVWVTLADFAPARLEVTSVRFVGGFGRAQTLAAADYLAAEPTLSSRRP
ncbi:MAG: pyridoxamine 5'-phosphate oxidase family protein [Myxococcaceae bacterium]|nr:pyridoxamine 5'-phosphate oxidase family protein [Myxococcaceae bacterium]